jgi:hypothetical protein
VQTPANGATGVELNANVVVAFTEPIDRASVTPSSIRLMSDQSAVPVAVVFSNGDRSVTLTPIQPLSFDTPHTVVVDTGVSDLAGNHVAAPVVSTFRTRLVDATPPRVSTIVPAPNAVDVPLGSFVQATFSEPIDPSTVDGTSVKVSRDGVALLGALTLLNANRDVRFTPQQPLPAGAVIVTEITSAIKDTGGNSLVDSSGNPLQGPLTFTFLTASFGITKPARGEDLLENRRITLEAQGSSALGLSSVMFAVFLEGAPFGQVFFANAPAFTAVFDVPSAADSPSLRILASGLDSDGLEVASDELTVNVVVGLRSRPSVLGVSPGRTTELQVILSSPIAADLPITLSAGDPSIVTLPASPVVLPAGQVELSVPIEGAAVGSTTVIASSARGDTGVVVSVSPLTGKTVGISGLPVGSRVFPIPSAGRLVEPINGRRTFALPLLEAPAPAETSVTVTTSNADVAFVEGDVRIAQGEQSGTVTIVTGAEGTATITFRVGNIARQLTVVVGTPDAASLGPIVGAPVGVRVFPPLFLGRILVPMAGETSVTLVLLSEAQSVDTPVTVRSTASGVADVEDVVIPAGQTSVPVTVTTGAQGTATLTFRAGSEVREMRVVVGQPVAGDIPPTVAPPVGVRLMPLPVIGTLIEGRTMQRSIVATVLAEPRASDTPVTILSSDPNVAAVLEAVTVPAGQVSTTFTVSTGLDGVAVLTLEAAGEKRELAVIVGTPPPGRIPAIVAPIVGIEKQ